MGRWMPYEGMDRVMYCGPVWEILLSLKVISGNRFDVDVWVVDYCLIDK
jgi:hypothetical protein